MYDEAEESYTVTYFQDGEIIDQTSIDEEDYDLAWYLFEKEFGHTRDENTTVLITKD